MRFFLLLWSNNSEKDCFSDIVEEVCKIVNVNHHANLAVIKRFSKHCSMTDVSSSISHMWNFGTRFCCQKLTTNLLQQRCDVFDNTRELNKFQCKQQTLQTNKNELKCVLVLWVHYLVKFLVGHGSVMVCQLVHALCTLMLTNVFDQLMQKKTGLRRYKWTS